MVGEAAEPRLDLAGEPRCPPDLHTTYAVQASNPPENPEDGQHSCGPSVRGGECSAAQRGQGACAPLFLAAGSNEKGGARSGSEF